MDRKTADRGARKFAQALEGPLGPRRMQAVVRDHTALFTAWRASGASWSQIATLLAGAGVRSLSGGLVSAAMWRALVSRAQRVPDAPVKDVPGFGRQRDLFVSPADKPSPGERRRPPAPPAKGAEPMQLADVRARIGRAASLRGVGRKEDTP